MKPYGFGGIVPMVHQILWSFLLNTVSSLTQYAACLQHCLLSQWMANSNEHSINHPLQASMAQLRFVWQLS